MVPILLHALIKKVGGALWRRGEKKGYSVGLLHATWPKNPHFFAILLHCTPGTDFGPPFFATWREMIAVQRQEQEWSLWRVLVTPQLSSVFTNSLHYAHLTLITLENFFKFVFIYFWINFLEMIDTYNV